MAGRAVLVVLLACIGWYVTMLALIGLFRFVDPPASALMLIRYASGQSIEQTSVPLAGVSPSLRRAVIASEDAKFCSHFGFDLGEIRAAMKAGDRFGRGASTISQQLSKNLFLWPGRSYVRKALEVPLTLTIEGLWPKRRIFEVYLNVAEWGPGIYGAEAAARHYFGKPAARLNDREAALLAVALPNPLERDASDPEPTQAKLAGRLLVRMKNSGAFPCVMADVVQTSR
jgi:monofunctional biosynthetic peptidoglycan transglycosylase